MDNKLPFADPKPEIEKASVSEKDTVRQLAVQIENYRKENERLRQENIELKNFKEEKNRYKPDKTFGLNVCGDVMLNKMEVEIVNTPAFQRLGFVNQLGSTVTVYRSANHTRFEHSLGVLKMADLMIQKIRNNKHSADDERTITLEEEQIIRLLALLHDIGHMPFGHTIEDEFNIFQSHDKHESRWDFFIGEKSPIGQIIIKYRGTDNDGNFDYEIGKRFHTKFYSLIKCEKVFTGMEDSAFMYDIVSNTVCADLLDYLNRDCQYTNLKLNFHPRFLDYLIIKKVINDKTKKSEKRIVIRLCKTRNKQPRKDIQSELVQLLRNRYYLGERVYYHHTKIKTGTLIAGAVLRAKEAGYFEYLNESYSKKRNYKEGDGPLYDIHNWGDVKLLVHLENIAESKKDLKSKYLEGAKRLTTSYLNREVYHQLDLEDQVKLGLNMKVIKEVIDKKIDETDAHILEMKLKNEFGDPISRLNAEEFICDLLPEMKSGDFLIYFPNYKMQMKLADVKIEEDDGIVRPLRDCKNQIIVEECNEIILKHYSLWMLRVLVHPRYFEKEHPGYKEEYKIYVRVMKKYCKWIFARTETEEKEFGEEFWKEIIDFKIDNELDGSSDETTMLYNPARGTERKNRSLLVAELAEQLSTEGQTKFSKNNENIKELITKTFKTNNSKQ
jgi:uncharacterized protein